MISEFISFAKYLNINSFNSNILILFQKKYGTSSVSPLYNFKIYIFILDLFNIKRTREKLLFILALVEISEPEYTSIFHNKITFKKILLLPVLLVSLVISFILN